MDNSKRSITLKIITGFVLASGIAFGSFWVIHTQMINYSEMTEISTENSDKLILVSQALTYLYDAESLSHSLYKNADSTKIELYKHKIDTILLTINKVAYESNDDSLIFKTNKIKSLIDQKNKNFEELLLLYQNRQGENFYRNAINELRKINESFGDLDYNRRFSHLAPHQRRVLIKFLKYSKKDNAQQLSYQTVDSIAATVKKVLIGLEYKEREFLSEVNDKEESLLQNDQFITNKLRELLADIENDEIKRSVVKIKASQNVLEKTSNIIFIVTVLIVVLVIIFLFLIIRDISKNQQYRTDLEAAKDYTESLLESRESLINTVTHDLRSPLNTVIGYSSLLEKTVLNHKQKHYLNHLKKSSDYILHLVNDLLDLSKLDAGKMTIEALPFSPNKLIKNTISSVIPVDDPKKLSIHLDIDIVSDERYISDPFRLKQVLTNLIHNAYKFTEKGSITVNSYIDTSHHKNIELVISIKDTGIGIPQEQQQQIFKEFEQGQDDIEKQYGGFGLGLAITKKIITLLQGNITLSSTPEYGSEFSIHIPVTSAIKNTKSVSDTDSIDASLFTNKRILIVDDDLSQLSLTSELVASIELQHHTCSNVKDALLALKENDYDLILTDIQMPDYDGFYLLDTIKQQKKYATTPVIALSGRTDISSSKYLSAGFYDNLTKPYNPNDLIQLIAKTLNTQIPLIKVNNTSDFSNKDYSLDDLIVFAHGDLDSLYSILDTFYKSTNNNLNKLKEAIQNKDISVIKKTAHKALPFFKQIKAQNIIRDLKQIEHPENYSLNTSQIITITENCIKDVENLIDALKNDIAKNEINI